METKIKKCPFCMEEIIANAIKCKHCHSMLQEEEDPFKENILNNNTETQIYSKTVAGFLALFLGGIGIHKLYLGKIGQFIIYLIFCWTFIPLIISFIEAISYFSFKNDKEFTNEFIN